MSSSFAAELLNYPPEQRAKVLAFSNLVKQVGLSDFSLFEGKITYSWNKVEITDPMYAYAKGNELWHYHIGLPDYKQGWGPYKTSEMVLHFQWPGQGNHIELVDLYDHYDSDGNFWHPPEQSLARIIVGRPARKSFLSFFRRKDPGP